MNKNRLVGLLLIFGLVLVSGCAIPEISDLGSYLIFETISEGIFSGHDGRESYVIKDSSEWSDLWNKVNSNLIPKPEVPNVDFNEEMVIAVFQGVKSEGGYDIKITEVRDFEYFVEVIVQETSSEPLQIQIQAETQPYHIVKIKRTDKKIVFKGFEDAPTDQLKDNKLRDAPSGVVAIEGLICEITANVISLEKTRTTNEVLREPPKENFDYYEVSLDILEITTSQQGVFFSCDDSYVEMVGKARQILTITEYDKNPIQENQRIKAKIQSNGDEFFNGYFISEISVLES